MSILPNSASDFELNIEAAIKQLLSSLDKPFPNFLDATVTAKKALPYLGDDRGVDYWSSLEGEEEQRKAIASQWQLRALGGKKSGLIEAARVIGIEAEVFSWHEVDLEPYHLRLNISGENSLTFESQKRLLSIIENIKSERDVVEIQVRLNTELNLGVAMAGYLHANQPFGRA